LLKPLDSLADRQSLLVLIPTGISHTVEGSAVSWLSLDCFVSL
jgi:hypothetical protein